MRRWILAVPAMIIMAGMVVARHGGWTMSRQPALSVSSGEVALGGELFRDADISEDGKISCASCHVPSRDYADNKPVSIGVYGRKGTRNAPSLSVLFASGSNTFFWDGRRSTLNQAVLDPMTNPVEMGLHDTSRLVEKIQMYPHYEAAFRHIFGDADPPVSERHIAQVLVAFIKAMPLYESAYDRFAIHGDAAPLDSRAKLGLDLFSGKARCAECHSLKGSPVTLTDNGYHRGGVGMEAIQEDLAALTTSVIQRSLQGTAVGDRVAMHPDESQMGRFNVTFDPADIGLFRTPSLRNVSRTAPYMHDGSVANLDEAIDREVYYRSLQEGHPLNLTVEERRDLKAFLQTL